MNEKNVPINEANVEELKNLDGVGTVRAQAIVDHRNKNGDFKNTEEIKDVFGIGDETYEKIKDKITLYDKTEIIGKRIKEIKATKKNTTIQEKDYYTLKDRIKLKRAMKKATKQEIRMSKKQIRLLDLNSKKNLLKMQINMTKVKIKKVIDRLSYYRISEVKKRISARISEKRAEVQRMTEEKMESYMKQQERLAALNETNNQLLAQLLGIEPEEKMQTAKAR